jgi:hypothetical protein
VHARRPAARPALRALYTRRVRGGQAKKTFQAPFTCPPPVDIIAPMKTFAAVLLALAVFCIGLLLLGPLGALLAAGGIALCAFGKKA